MSVTIYDDPTDTCSRYILLFPDAPTLANVHGLINDYEADELRGILVVTSEGDTDFVDILRSDDGTWTIAKLDDNSVVFEEIRYARDSDGDPDRVDERSVFVSGFTTDEVPVFVPA